jgi:hypothetical protein
MRSGYNGSSRGLELTTSHFPSGLPCPQLDLRSEQLSFQASLQKKRFSSSAKGQQQSVTMKSISIIPQFCLLSFISAAPTTNLAQTCVPDEPTIATFDDRQPVPVVSLVNPVGQYRRLRYVSTVVSWNIAGARVALSPDLAVPPVLGLLPQSGDNTIATGLASQTLTGPPAITLQQFRFSIC